MDWMPQPKKKKIGGSSGDGGGVGKWTFGRGPVLVWKTFEEIEKREEDEVGNVVISIRQSGRRAALFR